MTIRTYIASHAQDLIDEGLAAWNNSLRLLKEEERAVVHDLLAKAVWIHTGMLSDPALAAAKSLLPGVVHPLQEVTGKYGIDARLLIRQFIGHAIERATSKLVELGLGYIDSL